MQARKGRYSHITSSGATHDAPLSFQQERVLYLHKLSADGPLWNRISCKRLLGAIEASRLEDAVEALVERHPALRTRISLVDGEPRQSMHETLAGAFQCIDASVEGAPAGEDDARAILNREYEQPLSLEGGPLFKAVLVRCSEAEAWLILKLHHIISDATTLRILWKDLKVLYNGGVAGLRPLELDYFDYARWVREELRDGNAAKQESYWLRELAGDLPELDLPADAPAASNVTFSGASVTQPLPRSCATRLHSFSLDRRVIPFSTLMSAYYLLLRHYSRQDDLVVGTVFSGRHYGPQLRLVAGFFSNTVALRARVDLEWSVDELVRYVHARVTDAYDMQDYPFERLVGRLGPDRQHKRNPLFRAMFNMVADGQETQTFAGIEREEWRDPDISATQVDLFLDVHLGPPEAELRVEYNTDIFAKATMQRLLRHYVTILDRMMASPGAPLRDIGILDAAEEQLVLSLGRGPSRAAAPARGIVEMLEERASRTPAQPALLSSGGAMTCGDLNARVNQLAATLIEEGVGEAGIVAIMVDRSPEMLIALLAILKAGAAYLPIDPACPPQRIGFVLKDSGAGCLLVRNDAALALVRDCVPASITCIPLDHETSYRGNGANAGRRVGPRTPAYVLYTSGSTGTPKGVVVEHRALMNTLEFLEATYALRDKTILLKTNFTFDVSAAELFGWLFDGGKLAVLDTGAEKDPAKLLKAIDTYAVTHINFVPSMLDAFLSGLQDCDIPTLERLAYVFVAGEALTPDLVNRFHKRVRGVRLENLYGPTEAAIYATWHSLPRGEAPARVPIGRPIGNTRAYVVDGNLRLLPVGLIGELCLSGPGLARGYLNRPELTNERFCANPYWEGERLYRTGDLARWGEDGLIHYVGRSDGQLKVRGFRVELGEVQRKLLTCRGVAEAAVRARTDQFGQQGLVAYVSMENGRNGTIDSIRADMAAWLPDYMIPELFVELERLPRLPSGKIDLQTLPEPGRLNAPVAPREAASDLERTIIGIAEELLNATGLAPSSNFFKLGGNSLLTLRFIAALDAALGTHLSVMDFLELPTIAEIAALVAPTVSPAMRRAPTVGDDHRNCCAGALAHSHV